jgi:outer membrane biosynthesis protein TonB
MALYIGSAAVSAQSPSTDQNPPTEKSGEKGSKERNNGSEVRVMSDTGGFDVRPYLDRVLPFIKANWYGRIREAPSSVPYRKGIVAFKFNILKNGRIKDIKYVRPSGDIALDRLAYGGISDSSPLPSLPNDFGCKNLVLQLTFYYNQPMPVVPSERQGNLIPCVTTKINPLP